MIINPYLVQPSSAYGTLTTAWITATGETDTTILGALNTLESDLATYGLTSKMKALYPFVGGTASKHKYNFMNAQDTDAAFRLVFNGGWTHSSTGALPNGTNGWADTKINSDATAGIMSQDDSHISFYLRTYTADSTYRQDIAAHPNLYFSAVYNSNSYPGIIANIYVNGFNGVISNSDARGYYIGSRTSSTNSVIYKNGSSVRTDTRTSSNSSGNLYLASYLGTQEFGNREFSFVSIGTGLTDTEAANFYTAVQAFQTTLSRNV